MTLRQLEAFYLAATLGSFALAAERTHVTQSSLSKRIAELEAWAGFALFDRSGRKAQLTEAGQRLMPVASRMLELRHDARALLSAALPLTGSCRFGVTELGALTWLPQFVARVRTEHPRLTLEPHVDLGRRLERQVMRGELDCAIVPGTPETPRIASHLVDKIPIAWMGAPDRIQRGSVLEARDLARHPIITMTEGSALTQVLKVWAAGQSLSMPSTIASNSLMAIVGLTIAGVGLSFLPREFMRPRIERGDLVEVRVRQALPDLPFYFLQRDDDRRNMLDRLRSSVIDVVQYATSNLFY